MALTPPVIGSEAEIKDHLHRDLQAVAISQNVLDANFQIRVGRAFDQICQVASEIQADLIVLATHGRTGWERALLGSTAERIIRHAPCPVLVARQSRSKRKAALKLEKIVVPVDFSDLLGARACDYAVELAQLFGAELALLNVVQLYHDLPPVVVYTHSELSRWAREVAQAHMADLLSATDFGEVKHEAAIKMGSPAPEDLPLRAANRGRSHRDRDAWPNRTPAHSDGEHGRTDCSLCQVSRARRAQPGKGGRMKSAPAVVRRTSAPRFASR